MLLKRDIPWVRLLIFCLLLGSGAFVYGLFIWDDLRRPVVYGIYASLLSLSIIIVRAIFVEVKVRMATPVAKRSWLATISVPLFVALLSGAVMLLGTGQAAGSAVGVVAIFVFLLSLNVILSSNYFERRPVVLAGILGCLAASVHLAAGGQQGPFSERLLLAALVGLAAMFIAFGSLVLLTRASSSRG